MDQKTEVIQVFARTPIVGEVKTRLIPLLGEAGSCELHKEMILRLIKSLSSIRSDIEIWTDKDQEDPFLTNLAYPLIRQVGDDLGEKMGHAITKGLARYDKVALIGTDLPELDSVYLENAFKELDRYPVVIGPTSDGGFGLIALTKFKNRIFSGLR